MADGKGGVVNWVKPGYDEPSPLGGNRTQTDYTEQPEVKQTRLGAFHDRSWQDGRGRVLQS